VHRPGQRHAQCHRHRGHGVPARVVAPLAQHERPQGQHGAPGGGGGGRGQARRSVSVTRRHGDRYPGPAWTALRQGRRRSRDRHSARRRQLVPRNYRADSCPQVMNGSPPPWRGRGWGRGGDRQGCGHPPSPQPLSREGRGASGASQPHFREGLRPSSDGQAFCHSGAGNGKPFTARAHGWRVAEVVMPPPPRPTPSASAPGRRAPQRRGSG